MTATATVATDPVGVIEIARRRGVARETAHTWKRNGKLPDAAYLSVNGFPAWEWVEVAARFDDVEAPPAAAGVCDPVGVQEVAEMMGVAVRTVHSWKTARKLMPVCEYASVNGSGAWERGTVVAWAIESGRGSRLPEEFRPHTD